MLFLYKVHIYSSFKSSFHKGITVGMKVNFGRLVRLPGSKVTDQLESKIVCVGLCLQ